MNSLVFFEAAARHENFIKASNELCVTPGAVSRQIRNLENYLGFSLFVRVSRRVKLTKAGRDYMHAVKSAFNIISSETDALMLSYRDEPLHVWCSNLVMRHWLLPRLSRFHELYPKVSIMFSINRRTGRAEENFDLEIRHGDGAWPGLKSIRLTNDSFIPFCSRKYLDSHPKIDGISDLENHTLLVAMTHAGQWNDILRAAGYDRPPSAPALMFAGDALAYQAAMEGVGIALGRTSFLDAELKSGRLVVPVEMPPLAATDDYYVVYRSSSEIRPGLVEFRDWLQAEALKQRG